MRIGHTHHSRLKRRTSNRNRLRATTFALPPALDVNAADTADAVDAAAAAADDADNGVIASSFKAPSRDDTAEHDAITGIPSAVGRCPTAAPTPAGYGKRGATDGEHEVGGG